MLPQRPKLIVITPVRNEAWVLEAFLTHCSSWADHIILADQHSTDGSREIAMRFPKVILIDNPTSEWVENVVRTRLIEEAQRIEGDKILFALDADEFLSDGFMQTGDWHRIMASNTNVIYCPRWFNLYGDMQHGEYSDAYSEWIAHYDPEVDTVTEYQVHEPHAVHCQRVPCLETERCSYKEVNDFAFVHLGGGINRQRTRNKLDFYQVVNHDKNPMKANPISLYRSYTEQLNHRAPILPYPLRITTAQGEDITHLVRTSDHGQHYIDEMVAIFHREGLRKFRWLCIWDNPDLQATGVHYRPPMAIRLLHSYLRCTQHLSHKLLVRLVDKLLKRIIR